MSLESSYSKASSATATDQSTADTYDEQFHAGELSNDSEDDNDSNDGLFQGKPPVQRYVLNTEKKCEFKSRSRQRIFRVSLI